MIRELLARAKERKRKLEDYEENERVVWNAEEKKKSHQEREMIKILEREKQECIREALYWENKRRQNEERLRARNMMKFNPEFFNDSSVLKQKNIFLRGGFI